MVRFVLLEATHGSLLKTQFFEDRTRCGFARRDRDTSARSRWRQGDRLGHLGKVRRQGNPARVRHGTSSACEREPDRVYAVGQQALGVGYSLKLTRVVECTGKNGLSPGPEQLWLGLELVASALGPGSFAACAAAE